MQRFSHPALRIGVGLAALAALLVYAEPAAVLELLAQSRPPWLLLAAAAVAAATLVGAANAYLLVNRRGEVAWRHFLPVFWIAWGAGLLVPGQVGDLATISAILRRHDLDWRHTLGRSLLDKAISLLIIGALGAAGLLIAAGGLPAGATLLAALAAAALGLAALTALARSPLGQSSRQARAGLPGQVAAVLRELRATLADTPWRIAANFGLSVVKAALIGTAYWAMFQAMGATSLPWLLTLAVASASAVVAYVPVSVNGIGVVEAAGVSLFGLLEIGPALVLSTYIALRACVALIAGLPALILWLRLR